MSEARTEPDAGRGVASIGAGLLLVAGVLVVARRVWCSLDWPLVHDAPLMHYVAWRIGEGAVPYRDVFDMNFPGVYVLHLLVLRGLGTTDLAWRLFDLGWLALAALAVAVLAWPWGRLAALAGALLFALYHLAGGAWQSGQRDFLLCPFLLAGALGVARWVESGRRAALLGGGLALGASMTLKPHTVVLTAALGVMVAVAAWRRDARPAAPLGLFAAAAAVAPLVIVAWLAAAGALPAWRAIVVDYLVPLYSRLGRASSWSIYRAWLWIPLGAGVVLSLLSTRAAGRLGARHAAAALGALYGLLHFVGQGKGWEYHLYPLAAFALVLLVAGLAPGAGRAARPLALVTLAAVVVTGAGLAGKAAAVSDAGWERAKAARAADLAASLAARLRPGDTVQVLDTTDGGVHALLRLRVTQPTRFLYDFHFFHDTDQPAIQRLRAELIRDLDTRPPALVVLFEPGWPAGGYERLDAFPLLRERLARYDLVETGPGYRIHAQRHRP
jgi:hypothetical protein